MHAVRTFLPMVEERPWGTAAVALAPLLFVFLLVVAKLAAPGGYINLVREDGPVEWATVLAYILACGFAAAAAVSLRRHGARGLAALYALLAIGFFFVGGEEISWGQRVLGFGTPEPLAQANYKRELNLHNVYGFPLELAFVAVAFYGSFARVLVPRRVKARWPLAVRLLTPPPRLFLYFFVTFALYAYFLYVVVQHSSLFKLQDVDGEAFWQGRFIHGKDQEPIELLLAGGFLLFAWRGAALAARVRA